VTMRGLANDNLVLFGQAAPHSSRKRFLPVTRHS
jgi:hypothetical protein